LKQGFVAMLTVHIQVDRLPDVTAPDGTRSVQLGLRVSASVDAMPNSDPPLEALAAATPMLPWKWTGVAGGDWDIHDPQNWLVWVIPAPQPALPATPPTTTPPVLTPTPTGPLEQLIKVGTAVDSNNQRFLKRIESQIAGLDQMPTQSASSLGPVTDYRIAQIAGFVDSLTQLPAPLPAYLKVWTALQIKPAPDDKGGVTSLAAPRLCAPSATAGGEPATASQVIQGPLRVNDHYEVQLGPDQQAAG